MVIIVLYPAAIGGAAADKPAGVQPVTAGDISTLVTELGDESYAVREKATASLWKHGKNALPALRQVAEGKDPEASDRARELILYISVGVLFDSPQEVKNLVVLFSRSTPAMKLTILRKMLGMGQWRQVLHLAKLENDPSIRSKLSQIVKETATRAARDAIVKGDLDLAGEILELSADDSQSMLMLAWFHVRRGQLQEQLAQAAALPGKRGALWRMSLHRASGHVSAAITEAD